MSTKRPNEEKAPEEKAPLRVEVVPADNRSEADKASEAETQTPENTENRNKSYEPPTEGVNYANDEK